MITTTYVKNRAFLAFSAKKLDFFIILSPESPVFLADRRSSRNPLISQACRHIHPCHRPFFQLSLKMSMIILHGTWTQGHVLKKEL
jgi:hypothetical protein